MKPTKITFLGGKEIQIGCSYRYTTAKGKELEVFAEEFNVWGTNVAVKVKARNGETFNAGPQELK